jgi:tripartite-type tricarboxylate transporter receptor subunit TctC
MSAHDDIDAIISNGISIIEREVSAMESKANLTKPDIDKLLECLKTLVVVRKDWRQAEKEQSIDTKSLTPEELDAAILAEADKIKAK